MKKSRITIKDVAREAGVSVATVSFVMNGKGNLPQVTRDRVQEVCDRLGYKTNRRAANLRTGKSRTIGYIIPDLSNTGWLNQWYEMIGQSILGVSEVAARRGYAVVIVPPNSPGLMQEFGLDAVALNDSQLDDPDIAHAASLGIHIATQDRPRDSRISLHLDTGYAAMTIAALDELRAGGARRIALLTEPGGAASNTNQVAAYETWCEEHDNTVIVVRGSHDRTDLAQRVEEIMAAGADAIYSFYGEGKAIVEILTQLGHAVPQNVSVIAACPYSADQQLSLGISSTVYHPETMLEEPINRLLDIVEGTIRAPYTVHNPWELVVSDSSRPHAGRTAGAAAGGGATAGAS